MNIITKFIYFLLLFLFLWSPSLQAVLLEPNIILTPSSVIQGQPIMITVDNSDLNSIDKMYFNNKSLWFYNFKQKPTAIVGLDFYQQPGEYEILVKFSDGKELKKSITVTKRPKLEEPFSIPTKLGGNSSQNQTKIVSTLSVENQVIAKTKNAKYKYWTNQFLNPLKEMKVTDDYGYIRQTGVYNITHKGVDLRATNGTKVYAMNRGTVRLVKKFVVYGNTVIIDHGFGIESIYMHLSKSLVKEGQIVASGQNIALSGSTGYSEFPHLHLSLKINKTSVDPIEFLKLFKQNNKLLLY